VINFKKTILVLSVAIAILGFLDFYLNKDQNLAFSPIHRNNIPPLPKEELKTICQGEESKFSCYDKYYRALALSDLNLAIADLKGRYGVNEYVRNLCHPLIHSIGRTYAEKSSNVLGAFAEGDPFCWSGYYHGVMEQIVAEVGKDNLKSEINKICSGIPGRISFDRYNCVHGLGHGLMALTNNEVFRSLDMCNNLRGALVRSWCGTGVFMENVIADGKNHKTKYLNPDQPFFPCPEVNKKYRDECYLGQTSYVLKIINYDFEKVFDMCSEIEEDFRDECYISIGRDASGNTISNAAKTKEICELGKTAEQKQKCIEGAVIDFISYYHSDIKALELCNSLGEEIKPSCLKITREYWSIF